MSLSWRTILPFIISISLMPTVTLASTPNSSFASPEHVFAGNKINLRFSSEDPGQMGSPLNLSNGLRLTYGELLAMPDFYAVVDESVSQGISETERRTRFLNAFNSLATNPTAATEAVKIVDIIRNEQKTLDEGMKNGEKPEDVYKKIGQEFNRQYNCTTGGGCDANTWWLQPGRFLSLVNSKSNYDHFGENAIITYKVGHQLALEQAALAHKTSDLKMLQSAYAMNAFACHYISDRFSSGHMRTPRMELSEQSIPYSAGSLLASYMHNEESEYGLHVYNLRGDHWIAYGDKSYFNPKSNSHIKIMHEALQQSADAVFAAYTLGSVQISDHIMDLTPQPEETAGSSNQDVSPLFYWNTNLKMLMRRSDISNRYDKHWTASWWAWSTLIALARDRGVSDEYQAELRSIRMERTSATKRINHE